MMEWADGACMRGVCLRRVSVRGVSQCWGGLGVCAVEAARRCGVRPRCGVVVSAWPPCRVAVCSHTDACGSRLSSRLRLGLARIKNRGSISLRCESPLVAGGVGVSIAHKIGPRTGHRLERSLGRARAAPAPCVSNILNCFRYFPARQPQRPLSKVNTDCHPNTIDLIHNRR